MFYVYILKSKKDKDLYIGSTSNLRTRLSEHNSRKVQSTASRIPFELIYHEAYKSESDARKREKSLKLRGQARAKLMIRLSESLE